ncbi:MAG: site-2 protease family protein [Clostridia bacterium]|nr:site-2 protease family protein [Clostridia bacterium]
MFDRTELYIEWLKSDPAGFAIYMAYTVAVVLTSLILHECAHGYMALRCGDPTAKMMGRLSLNPAKHLDPIGTLCMFLLGFGWAKPVPVNPRNFGNYRRDDFLVSIAGIVTNLTLFLICSAVSIIVNSFLWQPNFITIVKFVYGSAEGLVNVFGSSEACMYAQGIAYGASFEGMEPYFQHAWLIYVQRFLLLMADVNLSLAIFNFLPIPPLDGYHLLNDTLFQGKLGLNSKLFQMTRVLLVVLIFTGVLNDILIKANEFVGSAVVRTLLMLTGQL